MTDPRFMRPGLDHAVDKVFEECGELIAALGKTMRFGWDSTDPVNTNNIETNAEWVRREMIDVVMAIQNLGNEMREKGF